ncbi:MAG TPA: cation:proton antiporter, partial [Pyrinomonadaceae bacterium]
MKRVLIPILVSVFFLHAASAWAAVDDSSGGGQLLQPALVGIAVMLIAAKLCGELFERMHASAVLGELFAGILLGNLIIFGFSRAEFLKTNEIVATLAEIGVIILLFEVGLESDLK